ncbi:uncharacterized protein KGF55_005211 [Candida pseudojiufengensis]|uniref:uncharacterized protein n=1 Tax=Candida pseudojiufengensis TaxID=497109 RepID=UPI002223F5EC|nr:uncharacterized protein KGF55_005211 [Candida pseudojiufengensis]KAI5959567.1 hypothetical protein KGF55_005211 [Candida pseudojiufengensis]
MSNLNPQVIPQYVPFDQTYVLYDPNDIVSIVSVQFTLLPIYIMVFYTSWFLITREIEPVIVVGGHLFSEILNKIIKKLVKNPRPDFHLQFGGIGTDLNYGMPSAHSQFIGFFVAYFTCIIFKKIPNLNKRIKIGSGLVFGFVALGVTSSRVYLQYHTWQQVIVGVDLGLLIGLFWFLVSTFVRDVGIVDWVLNWPIVRVFYVKDSYYYNYKTFKDEYNLYIKDKQNRNKKR